MSSAQPYLNALVMSPHGKCIPYAGDGLMRADGNANYGFKNLKIKPDLIETIPELAADADLKSLVSSLNAHPNFFSTGCFSQCISKSQEENLDEKQSDRVYHYCRGYIELAFNCSVHVQDAHNYFDLFFRFDSFLRQHHFPQAVKFDWQLEKAYFSEANVGGFSCAIFIRTVASPSLETATLGWQRSLQILETFFKSIPNQFTVGIYQLLAIAP
ncbi:MAG: hypothetical protein HC800_17275 [Phormidesmis sp. RL_2_1]|nr:hypothetical protein [Phormidesmis sp. RL_2_1]